MSDELVALCECWDIVEAHSLRASLMARGIPVLLEGEHHRAAMGMFGAAVRVRAMVPRSQLDLARQLAADLRPELGFEESDDDPIGPGSPARRLPPGEDAEQEPDEDAEQAGDDEDEPEDDALDEADDEDEQDLPRKKSLAAAMLVACIGLAVGTLHLYAGEQNTGMTLLLLAGCGVALAIAGYPAGGAMLLIVWAIDIGRGLYLLSRYNAAIDRAMLDRPDPPALEPS